MKEFIDQVEAMRFLPIPPSRRAIDAAGAFLKRLGPAMTPDAVETYATNIDVVFRRGLRKVLVKFFGDTHGPHVLFSDHRTANSGEVSPLGDVRAFVERATAFLGGQPWPAA